MDNKELTAFSERLDRLLKQQEILQKETHQVKQELETLKASTQNKAEALQPSPALLEKEIPKITTKEDIPISVIYPVRERDFMTGNTKPKQTYRPSTKQFNWEKFIGENLISKIGIVITILGVAVGAKYAIENQLISPLIRILFGYLIGLGLLGFAFKLKKNYETYSSILLSGSMAILYVITYFAYNFYELIPQVLTFLLMVIFTAFTVLASLHYNRQVIAIIGLVGAYAIPVLLSNQSGRIEILFSYISLINIGILIVCSKKNWQILLNTAFWVSWAIFFFWYLTKYNEETHFVLAMLFLAVFFSTFLVSFILNKLHEGVKLLARDMVLILSNAFLFFGIGIGILLSVHSKGQVLGLFTLINAILYFATAFIIRKNQLYDRNLFYLITGLVLVFLTLVFPIQFDGSWVSLFWAAEAVLLFWLGRSKGISLYSAGSYILFLLAFFSLIQDWTIGYTYLRTSTGIYFITNLIIAVLFGFSTGLIIRKRRGQEDVNGLVKGFHILIPCLFLIVLYMTFALEIFRFWKLAYESSLIEVSQYDYLQSVYNKDLLYFRAVWMVNYSFLFLSVLTFLNYRFIKNKISNQVHIVLFAAGSLIFLTYGLFALSELRESYLSAPEVDYYHTGIWNLLIRYLSLALYGVFVYVNYISIHRQKNPLYEQWFRVLIHIPVLWIASSELIQWMDVFHIVQPYKLGLSILWGLYSLGMIVLGIWKKQKLVRYAAMALFGLTLLKLFFYDIAYLNTLSKTIVFVSLGILLLVISFLYYKFKHIITEDSEPDSGEENDNNIE